jgi:hypothetical protein
MVADPSWTDGTHNRTAGQVVGTVCPWTADNERCRRLHRDGVSGNGDVSHGLVERSISRRESGASQIISDPGTHTYWGTVQHSRRPSRR